MAKMNPDRREEGEKGAGVQRERVSLGEVAAQRRGSSRRRKMRNSKTGSRVDERSEGQKPGREAVWRVYEAGRETCFHLLHF